MRGACEATRHALVTAGVEALPPEVARHAARCVACTRLLDGYHGGVERFAATTTLEGALRVPSFANVLMALPPREPSWLVRWGRWLVPIGVATGLAAGLVVWAASTRSVPFELPREHAVASITPSYDEAPIDQIADIADVADSDTGVAVVDWSRESSEVEVTDGAARFAVAPHLLGERFVVRTPLATVTAVGTEFGVAHHHGVTTIDISEGVILVEAPSLGIEVTLSAGQSLTLAPAPLPVVAAEPALVVAAEAEVAPKPDVEATLREARRLIAQDQAKRAIVLLEGIADGPRDRVAALLGDARRVSGDLRGAARAYEVASRSRSATVRERALEDLAATYASAHDEAAAASAWERYLAVAPRGRSAPKALLSLGRDDELLASFPSAAESTTLVVKRGRERLKARDWEGAVAVFTPWLDGGDASRVETALVGIMRARLGQGRRAEVGELGEWYRARFPSGARLRDVRQMLDAAGIP